MAGVRSLFLACSRAARGLAGRPEVAAGWDRPSALERWKLSGLTAHLARATLAVEGYLDAEAAPEGEPISAARYYELVLDRDLDSKLNVAVRQRGDEMAAEGLPALLRLWDSTIARLEERLPYEAASRKVRVIDDLVLRLDDYLVTRMLEMLVHSDDVAVSVGTELPSFPGAAWDLVIGTLVDVARMHRGDLAVLRALARRERDDVEALRVL